MYLTQPTSIPCGSPQRGNGRRLHLDRLLGQPIEQLAPRGRLAPVEPESEFVGIVVQVLVTNRALVGSQQPALEQRDYPMNPWEKVFVPGFSLDLPIVDITFQLPVSVQAVGSDGAARFDRLGNKSMQSLPVEIWDMPQTYATNALTILLGGDDDKCLVVSQPTSDTRFLPAPIRLVHLDQTPQAVPARPHHRSPELVEQSPSGFVAPKPKHPLESQGADAVLLARDKPHCPKPGRQRQMTVLEDRACRNRGLMSTICTQPKVAPHRPSPAPTARWATEAFGPAQHEQILPTGGFAAESLFH